MSVQGFARALRALANLSNRCAVSEPLSATPASVLRTLANPSNRCAVSEPVSATPASVLRTLANPYWGRLNERLPCVRGGGPRSGGRVVKEQSLTACGGAEPLSARPASMLRTLANPFTQGSLKTPR